MNKINNLEIIIKLFRNASFLFPLFSEFLVLYGCQFGHQCKIIGLISMADQHLDHRNPTVLLRYLLIVISITPIIPKIPFLNPSMHQLCTQTLSEDSEKSPISGESPSEMGTAVITPK
ncbi:MAG: hypothetical protein R2764_10805 [Bacteroidales bacterium]